MIIEMMAMRMMIRIRCVPLACLRCDPFWQHFLFSCWIQIFLSSALASSWWYCRYWVCWWWDSHDAMRWCRPPFFLKRFLYPYCTEYNPNQYRHLFYGGLRYGREREIWGSIIFIIQTQTPSIINKVRLTDPHWFDYSPPRKPSLQQVIIILYNGIWWWLPWPGSHTFFLWW